MRIAVIGAGAFGKNHLRVLRELPGATLAGVFDTDPGRAGAAAQQFACPQFLSLGELTANAEAAVVAAPTTAHESLALRLLDAGLDVLVEKPIAAAPAEAERMAARAAARGRILQVGHLERFNPAVQALEKLARLPLFFEIHRLSVFTPRSLDVDVVSDLMIHDLEIVLALTGLVPEQVHAAGIKVLSEKIDIANVRLEFATGCIANLTASRVSTERVRKLRMFQPNGYCSLDYAKRELFVISIGPGGEMQFQPQTIDEVEPLRAQALSFVECCQTRRSPKVDGAAGARALALAARVGAAISQHGEKVAQTLSRVGAS